MFFSWQVKSYAPLFSYWLRCSKLLKFTICKLKKKKGKYRNKSPSVLRLNQRFLLSASSSSSSSSWFPNTFALANIIISKSIQTRVSLLFCCYENDSAWSDSGIVLLLVADFWNLSHHLHLGDLLLLLLLADLEVSLPNFRPVFVAIIVVF